MDMTNEKLVRVFRELSFAIIASYKMGWIALGLYIQRLQEPANRSASSISMHEYFRKFDPITAEKSMPISILNVADDYRMALFPQELKKRLKALETCSRTYTVGEFKKDMLLKRAAKAKLALEGVGRASKSNTNRR